MPRVVVGAALLGFTLLTVAVFRPTPHELAHTAPAFRNTATDALLYLWALSHVSETLFRDPLQLFHGPIFYPARYTLAFSDHMIGQALLGLPVWWSTRNPLLEFNLLSLASYALSATAMFVCVRARGLHLLAAAAAGVAFAFTPYRFASPQWLQVLVACFMPLAVMYWLRFVRSLAWRDWLLWVGSWIAHSLMGMYMAFNFTLTMGVLGAFSLLASPNRHRPRLWGLTLLAPLAAGLVLAPTLWPYVALRRSQGFQAGWSGPGIDTPLDFFLPGRTTLSASWLGLDVPTHYGFGPGLVVVVLMLLGIGVGARRAWREAGWTRFAFLTNLAGLLLTLGMIVTPIRVYLALPAFDMMRGTNRAFYLSLLFVALFVAEAVSWLVRRMPSPRLGQAVALGLLALVLVDMGSPPRERKVYPVRGELPEVDRWLAELPDEVIYQRILGNEHAAEAMYHAIFHGKAIVNGYSGFSTAGSRYLQHTLLGFPAPEARHLLRRLGVRHVLWRFLPWEKDMEQQLEKALEFPHVRIAARFDRDVVFELLPEPPPPAPVPAAPLPREGWSLGANQSPQTLAALRDGDPATAWQAKGVRGQPPPALTVDLGEARAVAGLRCAPSPVRTAALYLATLETSLDGRNWSRVAGAFEPDSLDGLIERPGDLRFYALRFPPRRARYLRLSNGRARFWVMGWEIGELEVLGDCAQEALPGCVEAGPGS